jgi:very-short-patch-repair endonuclease
MDKADTSNNWNYNPKLRGFAKHNRENMTKAEACLWKYVIGRRQFMGYRFNRQKPIGGYIVDFLCKELRLIIEVDGLTHQFEEVAKKDIIREEELKAMGFTIIRFEGSDVLNDIANVERTLLHYVEIFHQESNLPLPPREGNSVQQQEE